MALCCIGGICIPYSAIVPLLLYGLQWVLQKLAVAGLLPPAVAAALERFVPTSKPAVGASSSCCGSSSSNCKPQQNHQQLRRSKISKQESMATTASASSDGSGEEDDVPSQQRIQNIESDEELNELLSTSVTPVLLKFTATWCKPCKAIQPLYEQLSTDNNLKNSERMQFAMVDADELDEAASRYGVVALPTFVACHGGKVVGKYAGSDEDKLRDFVERVRTKTK